MKRFALFLTLAINCFAIVCSQVPQKFSFQAVIRNSSNTLVSNQNIGIRISILQGSPSGTEVYKETYSPNPQTNINGLVTLQIGSGIPVTGNFSAINWAAGPYYIKTETDPAGGTNYTIIATSQLLSVPYALAANSITGTIPYMNVTGNTATMDSALFVVRNKNGQIVFAVYNEGVRIYVDDGLAKATTKGGFAIGSLNPTKGGYQDFFIVTQDSIRAYIDTGLVKARKGGFAIGSFNRSKVGTQEYFRVTRDSTRVYINDKASKAVTKGGFAIGGFNTSKGGSTNFLNVATETDGIINPSQNRILWYPVKNAFLTGKVLIEKPDSVGINSFASGYESKAKGQYSQALGYQAIARGDYSTAIGKNATASASYSFAFGNQVYAATGSYAFGDGVNAFGQNSFAFGSIGRDTLGNPTGIKTEARGKYSVAFGLGALATNLGSFAFGTSDTSSGKWSMAFGGKSKASGDYSVTMGYGSKATASVATAIGNGAKANGVFSSALGGWAQASGLYSIAIGNSSAISDYSVAIGYLAKSSSLNSLAFGNSTTASGQYSMALGNNTVASGSYSTALTTNSSAIGFASVALGHLSKARGNYSLALGYFVTTSGGYSSATGMGTIAQQLGSFVTGRYNTPKGDSLNYSTSYPLFIIGNGTDETTRSNAVEIYPDARSIFNGRVIVTGGSNLISHIPDITLSEAGIGIPSNFWKEWTFKGQSKKLNIIETNSSGSSTRMTFADGGNVGIGTETPAYLLDVNGNMRAASILLGTSSGPITQNWWEFGVDNGNGTGIDFHANSSAIDYSARIYRVGGNNGAFYIWNTGTGNMQLANGSSTIDLTSSGNIGIGTTAPSQKLDINGNLNLRSNLYFATGADRFVIYPDNLRSLFLGGQPGSTHAPYAIHIVTENASSIAGVAVSIIGSTQNVGIGVVYPSYKLQVGSAGDGTQARANAWNLLSDIRYKTGFEPLRNPLNKISAINGFYFYWNTGTDRSRQFGLSGQDVERVLPEVVSKGEDGYLSVDYGKLVPLLIEGIKDQQKQIELQQKEINELKTVVNTLVANQAGQGNK